MWPSQLCGLQPVEAQNSALSRSGTPHNPLLAEAMRPGRVSLATTNLDAGVDRQNPAGSWADPDPIARPASTPCKQEASTAGFRRTPEPDSLCGARPVSGSEKRAVARA